MACQQPPPNARPFRVVYNRCRTATRRCSTNVRAREVKYHSVKQANRHTHADRPRYVTDDCLLPELESQVDQPSGLAPEEGRSKRWGNNCADTESHAPGDYTGPRPPYLTKSKTKFMGVAIEYPELLNSMKVPDCPA